MELEEIYRLFLKNPCVTTDSRNCPKDSLFFALKGASFNGNIYAKDAVAKGCSYAFVDEKEYADEKQIIFVPNCLDTLQKLASLHRDKLALPIIGITGTNGKTTTKELIAAVLREKYNILYTQGNLNNHIGVPLTLLQLNKEHDLAIIEMGANHPGEIKTLVNISHPNFGIITNVGKAHIEGFGSFEGVIKTKCEMYDYIKEHQGSLFVNHDNEILSGKSQNITSTYYGKGTSTEGKIIKSDPFISIEWKGHMIKTQLIGSYNFENILASIAIGTYFKVSEENIVHALENYTPQNNRSQLKKTERNELIIDAYNANPTSMTASLSNFLQMSKENKIVVLGDMKELGNISEEEHQKIADMLNKGNLSKAFLIGPNFAKTNVNACKFNTIDEFIEYLRTKDSIDKATILIKGSNSMQLIKCIPYL